CPQRAGRQPGRGGRGRLMKRWLPYPVLSCGLLAMWLLLTETLAPGNVLLGVALALGAPWLMTARPAAAAGPRNPVAIARLAALVFVDIVRSNIAVAAIITGAARRRPT